MNQMAGTLDDCLKGQPHANEVSGGGSRWRVRWGGHLGRKFGVVASALAISFGGLTVIAPAASAAPSCSASQGLNVSTGGCDGDMQPGNVRMAIVCRVVGSSFEYQRYTNWHSRYECWWEWVGCGDQGRVRVTWFEY